jgi:polysaccharide pyruvyl transferase WcaK-like protein
LVYSRDREGVQTVKGLLGGNSERVRFAYDMAFALQAIRPRPEVADRLATMKRTRPLVGVNVSGLLYAGGYTRRNMFKLASDYPTTVLHLVRALIREGGVRILLVPHVFGDSPESDVAACRKVIAELSEEYGEHLGYLEGDFDQHEIKWIIGHCDLLIGSRMHACIAALSQCVPAVGLAYSQKFAGVLESIGGGARVIDLRKATAEETLRVVLAAIGEKDRLRAELQKLIPTVIDSVRNLFKAPELEEQINFA